MTATTHYHAYAYTGRGYKDSEIGRVAPPTYPPILVASPGGMRQAARLDSLDAAVDWLKGELTSHEPLDAASFPVDVRLEYSRARLQETAANIVVYGYWSRSRQYVARRIYPCTTPGCSK